MAKLARDEAHRRMMARRYPPKPAPLLPKCLCGLTYREVEKMWAVDEGAWPRRVDYYCPACVPDGLRGLVVPDDANLQADDG